MCLLIQVTHTHTPHSGLLIPSSPPACRRLRSIPGSCCESRESKRRRRRRRTGVGKCRWRLRSAGGNMDSPFSLLLSSLNSTGTAAGVRLPAEARLWESLNHGDWLNRRILWPFLQDARSRCNESVTRIPIVLPVPSASAFSSPPSAPYALFFLSVKESDSCPLLLYSFSDPCLAQRRKKSIWCTGKK